MYVIVEALVLSIWVFVAAIILSIFHIRNLLTLSN